MSLPAAGHPGSDADHMRAALTLAGRGLGLVSPNPAVGCILTRDDRVIGRGWTQAGGRPHAETEALRRAGAASRSATAYVTLEPCAHHGATPPCADALIAAGIRRVVVALVDPDPRVAGTGIDRLRQAGIETELGLMADAAAYLNRGFLLKVTEGRPLVTLKLATSLDGKIATHAGESRWITGPAARAMGHLMRRRHDAVMVGSGTVQADDPSLDVRLPGLGPSAPARIIADGRMRTPLTARLVRAPAQVRTILVTLEHGDVARRRAFAACGVEIIEVPAADGLLDLGAALRRLAALGFTRILVEGGATLAASLLRDGFVDRLAWFRSASVIGGDGLAAVKAFGVEHLAEQRRFVRRGEFSLGEDILETFERST